MVGYGFFKGLTDQWLGGERDEIVRRLENGYAESALSFFVTRSQPWVACPQGWLLALRLTSTLCSARPLEINVLPTQLSFIVQSLDTLGLALASEHHVWTIQERAAYERSLSYLHHEIKKQDTGHSLVLHDLPPS